MKSRTILASLAVSLAGVALCFAAESNMGTWRLKCLLRVWYLVVVLRYTNEHIVNPRILMKLKNSILPLYLFRQI